MLSWFGWPVNLCTLAVLSFNGGSRLTGQAPCRVRMTWPQHWRIFRGYTQPWGTCPFSKATGASPPYCNSGRPTLQHVHCLCIGEHRREGTGAIFAALYAVGAAIPDPARHSPPFGDHGDPGGRVFWRLHGHHNPHPPFSRDNSLFKAVSLNLRRGLSGKVQALGSCLRGRGYPDLVGLQEVGKLLSNMVAHVMYRATFTPAAHPAAGVGVLIGWHPIFQEIGRDMHPNGRGLALEYRSRGGRFLALVCYFPADQDVDVIRNLLAWALGLLAPGQGVHTLMLGDLNANPGWASGFRKAPNSIATLWGDFLRDMGISRCTPRVEVPT